MPSSLAAQSLQPRLLLNCYPNLNHANDFLHQEPFMEPLQNSVPIDSLPKEILIKIIETCGFDIHHIKLRQVSKAWKALMDTVFKNLFKEYEESPILKSIAEQV